MHYCAGYFHWCYINWERYKRHVLCLLNHIIFISATLSAKHLDAASFRDTRQNSHRAQSNTSGTTKQQIMLQEWATKLVPWEWSMLSTTLQSRLQSPSQQTALAKVQTQVTWCHICHCNSSDNLSSSGGHYWRRLTKLTYSKQSVATQRHMSKNKVASIAMFNKCTKYLANLSHETFKTVFSIETRLGTIRGEIIVCAR